MSLIHEARNAEVAREVTQRFELAAVGVDFVLSNCHANRLSSHRIAILVEDWVVVLVERDLVGLPKNDLLFVRKAGNRGKGFARNVAEIVEPNAGGRIDVGEISNIGESEAPELLNHVLCGYRIALCELPLGHR